MCVSSHECCGRCWSQTMHSVRMPYATAGVWSTSPETRVGCMQHQRRLLEALEKAHGYASNHKDAVSTSLAKLLKDIQWHKWQISLEALTAARKAGYSPQDNEVRQICLSLHCGQSNSKFTSEDIFGHLQHITQRSQKGCNVMNKCGAQ